MSTKVGMPQVYTNDYQFLNECMPSCPVVMACAHTTSKLKLIFAQVHFYYNKVASGSSHIVLPVQSCPSGGRRK